MTDTTHTTPGRHGMPMVALTHPSGASADVYLHGAHVAAWRTPAGEELLFLSRQALFEPGRPIRGGIPVIFPQFGPGALPQHGLARTREWSLVRGENGPDGVRVVFGLTQTPGTSAQWPHPFRLELDVLLQERALTLALRAANAGDAPFAFTAAFHTYFQVADIRRMAVLDLKGVAYVDSLRDDAREAETREAIRFEGETDRIYVDAPDRVRLVDEGRGRTIAIEKAGLPDVVVWNPWADKSQRMADFGDDEYTRMVCVETAAIAQPVSLAPGAEWVGTTVLRVVG